MISGMELTFEDLAKCFRNLESSTFTFQTSQTPNRDSQSFQTCIGKCAPSWKTCLKTFLPGKEALHTNSALQKPDVLHKHDRDQSSQRIMFPAPASTGTIVTGTIVKGETLRPRTVDYILLRVSSFFTAFRAKYVHLVQF